MPVGFEGAGGDEDGRGYIPPKGTPRPGGGPPGGGPGGGPGGVGFGGFGGIRPQIFRGLPSIQDSQLPILMRKRGLSPAPGVMPGAPGKSDTVPAMLSPGEAVASNGAQDMNPGLLEEILRSNQAAAGLGYEDGGVVPDEDEAGMGMGQEMPSGRPSRALRILQLLLELDEMDEPEGFAFGGVAGAGKFGGWMKNRMPQPGAANPSGPSGVSRDAGGNVNQFNPGNPWGTMTQSTNPTAYGQATRLLGGAGQAGYFDPRGNQMLINSQIEGAQGTKDALVRRQMNAADLGGLDPAQQAVARLQALRETGRGVQDISAQIRGDAMRSQDDFYKNLMRDMYGADTSYILGEQGARNDRIRDQNQGRIANQSGGGYWGRLAGNVAGGLAGGFLGGGGGGAQYETRSGGRTSP